MRTWRVFRDVFACAVVVALPEVAGAADPITIVEVRADRSTVHTAGIQVLTSDDDNRNATVSVRVRELGQTRWTSAPSLFRVRIRLGDGRRGRCGKRDRYRLGQLVRRPRR
jgi:hypothetical protein